MVPAGRRAPTAGPVLEIPHADPDVGQPAMLVNGSDVGQWVSLIKRGVASTVPAVHLGPETIGATDCALCAAKRGGRNRVVRGLTRPATISTGGYVMKCHPSLTRAVDRPWVTPSANGPSRSSISSRRRRRSRPHSKRRADRSSAGIGNLHSRTYRFACGPRVPNWLFRATLVRSWTEPFATSLN
jgi:hypothetical protein